jgi:hypothetical protein
MLLDLEKLRRDSIDLMAASASVYLTTFGLDGFPNARAMPNLRNRKQSLLSREDNIDNEAKAN